MEIRFSKFSDISQLKHIWKVCFGDSDAYIETFFQRLYMPDQTVVACCKDKVFGVVYMLKALLGSTRFQYGYAIGVLPEYRGNSVCKKMLQFIKMQAATKNFVFGLHPANKKLASFYQRIGLNPMYQLKQVDDSNFCGSKTTFALADIGSKTYYNLRERAFPQIVSWDEQMLHYIISDVKNAGGFAKMIELCGEKRIILGRSIGDTLFVEETTMTDDEIVDASPYLRHYFHAEHIVYTLPPSSSLSGETETTVFGFGKEDARVYMNLFLA